jgi:crotonobetainyl-CoA:carnitine CoA-transferase CaiB-like acyl-CoA transferase
MPIKYPASESPDVTPSSSVGEHTSEVLAEVAGYSEKRIDELAEKDAF